MTHLGLTLDPETDETDEAVVADETAHTDELGGTRRGLASFARDLAGELYLVLQSGEIDRLASDEPPQPEIAGPTTRRSPGGR